MIAIGKICQFKNGKYEPLKIDGSIIIDKIVNEKGYEIPYGITKKVFVNNNGVNLILYININSFVIKIKVPGTITNGIFKPLYPNTDENSDIIISKYIGTENNKENWIVKVNKDFYTQINGIFEVEKNNIENIPIEGTSLLI